MAMAQDPQDPATLKAASTYRFALFQGDSESLES